MDSNVQWPAGQRFTPGSLICRVGQFCWCKYSRHNCFQAVNVTSLNWEETGTASSSEPTRGGSITNLTPPVPGTLLFQ